MPFRLFPTTQDSEDIHYEVRLVRRIHKRKCYLPSCQCGAVAGIVMAPTPGKPVTIPRFHEDKYQPVLLETFVQKNRFNGTCYRAANWTLIGQTQGRRKLDRYNKHSLPVKNIFSPFSRGQGLPIK